MKHEKKSLIMLFLLSTLMLQNDPQMYCFFILMILLLELINYKTNHSKFI
uniref:Uncharacterized protein n=1 Tax=Physcomitrium patens TaxID=3218 RepID=A0A2K1JUN9_PHYPA|nr:hypothetical protein PHYPA_015025 [Physcomitrium patens]